MSARDEILTHSAVAEPARANIAALLDALAAEVRTEARAEDIAILRAHAERVKGTRAHWSAAGLRQAAIHLEKATPDGATATPTPGFFEPEHTYQRGYWTFQCLAVAPAPHTGEVHAVGYLARHDGTATVHGLGLENWEHDGWVDATEAEART